MRRFSLEAYHARFRSTPLSCARDARSEARLAQSVERQPFKLVVVGSSPTVGGFSFRFPSVFFQVGMHLQHSVIFHGTAFEKKSERGMGYRAWNPAGGQETLCPSG